MIGDGSGYIVYIPDGIYLISAPLLLKPGVTLRGVGQRPTILRMANGANCTMITNADINNATYVAIENLRLDGNKANNSAGNGISMASMFMTSRIQNVMIENCPYYGLAIGGCDELEICNLVVGHNGLGGLSADGCNRMSIQNVEAGSHEVGPGILIKNSYGVVVGLNMNVEQSGTATGLTGVHLDSVYDSTFAGIAFSTGAVSHAIGVQISNTSTPGQTRGLTLLGVHNGSPGYSTLIDDQVNSIQKTGTNVAFYTTDPETLQLRNHRFIRRTSGGWVCNSAGITNLDTSMDIVLPAATGDVIEVSANGYWENDGPQTSLDVATIVSGSPVTYFSFGSGAVPSEQGIVAWNGPATTKAFFGAPARLTLGSGDISGGTVTLRLRYQQPGGAGNRTLYGTGHYPFQWHATNLGPAA